MKFPYSNLWDILQAAAEAIGKIVTINEIPLLQSLLQDEDPDIWQTASIALDKIVTVNEIPLLQSLLRDKNRGVRQAAAYAFGKVGTVNEIPLLQPLLCDKDYSIRRSAAYALGEILTVNEIPLLKPLLCDEDYSIRRSAVYVLGEIITVNEIPLLKPLLRDKDWIIRRLATKALGKIGTVNEISLLRPLLRDWYVRREAAEALGKIVTINKISLLQSLLQGKDRDIRRLAADALGKIITAKEISLLQPLLLDKDPDIRRAATDVLGKIGTVNEISLLKSLLRDEEWRVRRAAADALGKIGTVNEVPLLQSLLQDEDVDVRQSAAYALGKIGTVNEISLLQPLLRDKFLYVRQAAAEALSKIGTVNEIPLLQHLLQDEDVDVRQSAAYALGKIGTVNEIPLLQPLLRNKFWDIRETVIIALNIILAKSDRIRIITNIPTDHFRPILNYQPILKQCHILHISDLHYTKDREYMFSIVFNDLIEKLKKWQQRENTKIDMICITGDLVWSGEELQYLEMVDKLTQLLAVTGCSPERLFIVPGNHDIQDFCKEPPDNEDLFKKIYEQKVDINQQILNHYNNYSGFLDKLANYHKILSGKMGRNFLSGQIVTGEVKPWYAIRIEAANLVVIGLNSALFTCKRYHHPGQIKIGLRQFQDACEYIHPLENEQIIVLIHHSQNWLDEPEGDDLANEMFKKYVIHLYGHKHRHRGCQLKSSSDEVMLQFAGGSICGDNGTEDGYNSFEIISIDYKDLKVGNFLFTWDPAIKQWGPRIPNIAAFDLPVAMRKNI
jgi:HEAT repeat protein